MIGHPSILNSPIVRWTYVTFWEASRMGEVWLRLYKRPTFCPGTALCAGSQLFEGREGCLSGEV